MFTCQKDICERRNIFTRMNFVELFFSLFSPSSLLPHNNVHGYLHVQEEGGQSEAAQERQKLFGIHHVGAALFVAITATVTGMVVVMVAGASLEAVSNLVTFVETSSFDSMWVLVLGRLTLCSINDFVVFAIFLVNDLA